MTLQDGGYDVEMSCPFRTTMNEPHSHIPDELLSAYLDEELSPAEQAKVDRALAKDQGLRALLAELRQIRTDIRRLPRHQLPASFSDRVVRTYQDQLESGSTGVRPRLRARQRRTVAILLMTVAASVLVAAWIAGPARRGGPAREREVATRGMPAQEQNAAVRADRVVPETVDPDRQLDEQLDEQSEEIAPGRGGYGGYGGQTIAPGDLDEQRPEGERAEGQSAEGQSAGGEYDRALDENVPDFATEESLTQSFVELPSRPATDTEAGEPLLQGPSSTPSELAADQDTAQQPMARIAQVELKVPQEKIALIKAQLQGPQVQQRGLKVTDLLEESRDEARREDTGPPAYFYRPQGVQPEELLLLEGTQAQIAAAVQQLDTVSTDVPERIAQQLRFALPPGGDSQVRSLRSPNRDAAERSAGADRQLRSRRSVEELDDVAPSQQQTASELSLEDALGVDDTDAKKETIQKETAKTPRLAAGEAGETTGTPSLLRQGTPASAAAVSSADDRQGRLQQDATDGVPRYRVLLLLRREGSP